MAFDYYLARFIQDLLSNEILHRLPGVWPRETVWKLPALLLAVDEALQGAWIYPFKNNEKIAVILILSRHASRYAVSRAGRRHPRRILHYETTAIG